MSSLDKCKVILGDNNYGRWKTIITSILEAKEVIDVVTGVTAQPAVPAAGAVAAVVTAYKAWKKDDATARVILVSSLDDQHEQFVRGCTTSKQIMDTIRRLKESTATPNVQLAWQELHELHFRR